MAARTFLCLLTLAVALSTGSCRGTKTIPFSSPTGRYSVRLPESHASVETYVVKLPIRRKEVPCTVHWAARTTEDPIFEMDHLELPAGVVGPDDRPLALLKEVLGVWSTLHRAIPEGESKEITLAGFPALETILRFDLSMSPYVESSFQTTPINFRTRALIDQDRVVILSFGMMSRWQLDDRAGKDFFLSFKYPEVR